MKLIHAIGCCLLLAIVLTPAEGGWLFGKSKDDDIDVGLVKEKKTSQPQKTSKPQKEDTKPAHQATGKSKTDPKPSKEDTEHQPKVETSPVKGKDPSPSTPSKDVQKMKESDATAEGTSPVKQDDKTPTPGKDDEKTQDSKAMSVVDAQKEVDKTKKDLKKLNSLQTDLVHAKNKDESSLDSIIENLVDIAKKRTRVKAALLIYSLINLILYVAQYAGGFITPPIGRALYFLDILAKNVIRKPLDDYYAEYQQASSKAVAKYVHAHPDEYKNIKKGKKVSIKHKKVNFDYKLLKTHPDEELTDTDLHFVDNNPFTGLRVWFNT